MEIITDITDLVKFLKAGDFVGARVPAGKLLVVLGNFLIGGKPPTFAGEALETAIDELETAVKTHAAQTGAPVVVQAKGDLMKRLLALLLQLLPILIG